MFKCLLGVYGYIFNYNWLVIKYMYYVLIECLYNCIFFVGFWVNEIRGLDFGWWERFVVEWGLEG